MLLLNKVIVKIALFQLNSLSNMKFNQKWDFIEEKANLLEFK